MKKSLIVLIVLAAIVLIGGCQACNLQKSLVGFDEGVKSKWSEVENQYQRRSDLIGNLVETVKGAAKHEQGTFTAVAEARSKATQMTVDPSNLTEEQIAKYQSAQGELSQALGRLLMITENYPELKVNENFLKLQDELAGTNNRIAVARQNFNESVREYNVKVRTFPNNFLAGMLGFQAKGMFKAEAGAEKNPDVKF